MKTGTREAANELDEFYGAMRNWHRAPYNVRPVAPRLSRDFEELSGGGIRNVFLHKPSDVVYKVDCDTLNGYTNSTEYRHARALRKRSDAGWIGRVYVPAVTGYKTQNAGLVLAMEKVNGSESSFQDPRAAFARFQLFKFGFEDMHGHNFFVLPGNERVAVIDMGSPRRTDWLMYSDMRVLAGTSAYKRAEAIRRARRIAKGHKPCACGCDAVF